MGLHDVGGRRYPGGGAPDTGPDAQTVPTGIQSCVLRDAGGILSGRGTRIHQRLEAIHRGQPGRHLRPHRADGAIAAGGAIG